MSKNDSSGSNGGEDCISPSASDTKFFAVMFKHLPKNLDIDWEEFAREMGFKDGGVAKVRCRQIRVKLGVTGTGTDNSVPNTPTKSKTPKTPTPKANKVTKPRKTSKAKQPKVYFEASDYGVHQDEKAPDAQDDEDKAFV